MLKFPLPMCAIISAKSCTRLLRRRTAMLSLTSLALCQMLESCVQPPAADDYPISIKKALQREFPADGNLHIQHRGRFDLKPSTIFCTFRPGSGLDPSVIISELKSAGQSDYWNGSPRGNGSFGERTSSGCDGKAKVDSIFVRGESTPNRAGQPYKLTIAIWQGEAVWVGMIERLNGMRSDATAGPVAINDGPSIYPETQDNLKYKSRQNDAMRLDNYDLSKAFFKSLGN